MPWTSGVIATDRMTLRCPTDDDRPAIRRILTDADVRRYLGGPVFAEVALAFEPHPIGERPGVFAAVLAEGGQPIGTFSLGDQREDLELSPRSSP